VANHYRQQKMEWYQPFLLAVPNRPQERTSHTSSIKLISNFYLKRPPSKAAFRFNNNPQSGRYFAGVAFGRRVFESILGTCVAPSSALKYGSSLKPNSFAEMTVGNLARVVL
jgi:hypothetical protein